MMQGMAPVMSGSLYAALATVQAAAALWLVTSLLIAALLLATAVQAGGRARRGARAVPAREDSVAGELEALPAQALVLHLLAPRACLLRLRPSLGHTQLLEQHA